MAEMEVSPHEEMANPQGIKVFAVERPELPEDFVSFPSVWSAIVATRVCSESADCLGSATVVVVVVVFFTLTDRASIIPSNTRGCQSGTWSAGQKKIRGTSTKLQ